jgi:hypothetical protein
VSEIVRDRERDVRKEKERARDIHGERGSNEGRGKKEGQEGERHIHGERGSKEGRGKKEDQEGERQNNYRHREALNDTV